MKTLHTITTGIQILDSNVYIKKKKRLKKIYKLNIHLSNLEEKILQQFSSKKWEGNR